VQQGNRCGHLTYRGSLHDPTVSVTCWATIIANGLVKLSNDRSGAHVDVPGNGGVVCQMPLPRTPSLRPDGRCATATGTARGIGLGVLQRSIRLDCIMVGNERRACGLQYRPN
jgi:hypothetical protein